MQKEKEPPTPPTYEDLEKLSINELRKIDTSNLPAHLISYIVGRLDQSFIERDKREQKVDTIISHFENKMLKSDLEWSDMILEEVDKTEKEKKFKEQAEADLLFEQYDKQRILKIKVVEKANVNNARYKSVDQAKADIQFAKLHKPERMKRGRENRTTIKVADVFTKVNLLIMERYEQGCYNNFSLRGKQVEKWIALFKNNYSISESAKALGIKEDSLRRNMKRLTDAMNELFLETFDSEYGRNEITKSDLFNYIQKKLEKTDR